MYVFDLPEKRNLQEIFKASCESVTNGIRFTDCIFYKNLKEAILSLYVCRKNVSDEEFERICQTCNIDVKNPKFEVREELFLEVMSYFYEDHSSKEDVMNAFRNFDPEGTGFVQTEEFKKLFSELGSQMTPEEYEQFFIEADPEGSGKIEYSKIVDLIFTELSEEEREQMLTT